MDPQVKALVDALAKLGVNLTPYVKYVLLAVGLWYVFVALMAVVIFGLVIWQFVRISRDF